MSRLRIGSGAVTALATTAVVTFAGIATGGPAAQDENTAGEVALVTVVGCLTEEVGDLPWVLERATEGEPTEQAFTSEEEIARSAAGALGSLQFRLLGVGEFGIEPHIGHRVQVKGLKLRYDGEWRLNITSFQQLASTCE